MTKFRQPMNPVLQNGLIMIASCLVASMLCAKVYGATLPAQEPAAPAAVVASATPGPSASTDAAAAAQLRAMLRGQPVLLGTPAQGEPRQ